MYTPYNPQTIFQMGMATTLVCTYPNFDRNQIIFQNVEIF
jgi:hypothetical protein